MKFGSESSVLVSVHVRRTDYQKYMQDHRPQGGLYLSRQFFIEAMDYFREKYQNPLFIVASDDQNWAKRNLNLSDVVFTFDPATRKEASARLDLTILGGWITIALGIIIEIQKHSNAFSAKCDHSISSYGTFSFWAAYLKPKGTNLFYDYYFGRFPAHCEHSV